MAETADQHAEKVKKQNKALEGKADTLERAANKLQGVAYDLQTKLETPLDVKDVGIAWQGEKRQEFESAKADAVFKADHLRTTVDRFTGILRDRARNYRNSESDL